VLTLSSNSLTGPIPECLVTGLALKELYLSGNRLEAPLPDAFANSRLVAFFAHSQANRSLAGQRPRLAACAGAAACRRVHRALGGPAAQGSPRLAAAAPRPASHAHPAPPATAGLLPRSLERSPIRHLSLAGNALAGQVVFAPMLLTANLSSNDLSGQLPQVPVNMASLDISYNHLSGQMAEALAGQKVGCTALAAGRWPLAALGAQAHHHRQTTPSTPAPPPPRRCRRCTTWT
jgi:hypothetical protein